MLLTRIKEQMPAFKKFVGSETGTVRVVYKQHASGPDMTYVLKDCLTFRWGEPLVGKDLAFAILENLLSPKIASLLTDDFEKKVVRFLPANWEINRSEIYDRYEVELTLEGLRNVQ